MNFLNFDADDNYTRAGKANETGSMRGEEIFLRQAQNRSGLKIVTAMLNPGENPIHS